MKKGTAKKTLSNLASQKVDSDKIQGGLSIAQPYALTKKEVRGSESNQQNNEIATGFTSNVHSDGSILSKRGIKKPKTNT